MDTLATRVIALRKEKGWTQKELAQRAGISQTTVANIEQGRNQSSKALVDLARAFGVTAEWLGTGKGDQLSLRPVAVWNNEEELTAQGDYIFLPELTVRPSAGPGTQVWHVDSAGQRQAFTAKWAKRMHINPDCAATMVVSGESMEPRLLDGDSIVVDYCQNETIIDGKVYVLLINDEVKVKRLFKSVAGGLIIRSDNPDKTNHPDFTIAADELAHIRIVGRVVAVCGGI